MPKKIIILLVVLCKLITVHAQDPSFFHLSTAEGLSDNQVNSIARDRNGILWIGTLEGLNSFDGHSITTYYKEQFPALRSNQVLQVLCDYQNRVWLRTDACAISMLDERRRIHAIRVGDNSDSCKIRHIILNRKYGLLALQGNTYYYYNEDSAAFAPLPMSLDSLLPQDIYWYNNYDEDKMMYRGNNKLVMLDLSRLQHLATLSLPGINGAATLNENEIIAWHLNDNRLLRINWRRKKIVKEYKDLKDQYGAPLAKELRNMRRIDEHRYVITTRFSGAYLFDIAKETITRWHHDPVNPRSLGSDNTSELMYDSASGYLFIMSRTSGAHYANIRRPAAVHKSYFQSTEGALFDGYIQCITMASNDVLWLGTQDRLIRWDRKNNQTRFIDFSLSNGEVPAEETIRGLAFDPDSTLWVGTARYGIVLLNKYGKTVRQIETDTDPALPSNAIFSMVADDKGSIWAGTFRGLCKIDIATRKVTGFSDHPALKALDDQLIFALWLDHAGRLWIGAYGYAWCYDPRNETVQRHPLVNNLNNERAVAFNEDRQGNIYIGSMYGLTVLMPDGKRLTYNRTNGLRNDKCEGILRDDEGQLWICNQRCILRYDPATRHFVVFEEGQGFSHGGFRMRSCYKSPDGELFWASDKGLYYFYPNELQAVDQAVHPAITGLKAGDTTYLVTCFDSLLFKADNSQYTFRFTSGDLSGARQVQFMYRLVGYGRAWSKPVAVNEVSYPRLTPGSYRFELKASRDGKTWHNAPYPIAFTILKPWWVQTWFRLLCAGVVVLLAFGAYTYLQKRKRASAIRKMIRYFAHSGHDQASVTDILWDICRNCIASLRFEDCVIYLVDEDRKMLVQKAAYGPKSLHAREIVNPIEIPVGKGIVGTVAATGRAIVVPDTSKDERYIVDDEPRLSEMAVPLIHQGKVIGIIDTENKQRHFFTRQHLHAVQTIATLCSAKISRAMALEAIEKSRLELMELNMKMAESKFLNLRLQMNPHFLFNALSSIQNLIVSQQTTRAYKYLTLFSHFLRSLLTYADKNFITLDEEVTLLRMYIQLESLRFDKSFQFEICVDETLVNDEIWIPPLLVQPFAENAIWHGLMHKQGEKKLQIRFIGHAEEYITCLIEDNGVGRDRSQNNRQKKLSTVIHKSKGIEIVKERLRLLQQKTGKTATVDIEDLHDEQQQATGTRVAIVIPYYNEEV